MERNRKWMYLILLLYTFGAYSQNDKVTKPCQLYLEPIFGFNLAIGDGKKDVLENFEKHQKIEENVFKYAPKDTEAYTASKRIKLPNGCMTDIDFNLFFKQDSLSTYNFSFSIGADYTYFWKLISYIQKHDTEIINSFIYADRKRPSYLDLAGNEIVKEYLAWDGGIKTILFL